MGAQLRDDFLRVYSETLAPQGEKYDVVPAQVVAAMEPPMAKLKDMSGEFVFTPRGEYVSGSFKRLCQSTLLAPGPVYVYRALLYLRPQA